MTTELLDNIVWHSLIGPHAGFSLGTSRARRLLPGFTPFIGFSNPARPDFAGLAPFCNEGERFFCGAWSERVESAWPVDFEVVAHQMVWDGSTPAADVSLAAVQLDATHVPQMLELVTLTQPGPFGPRTVELGDYFGVFEDGRLVSMAGERLGADAVREVSGVCTHPDFRGRSLARRLMEKLIRLEIGRGQTPFLHVMYDNEHALRMYRQMGFRTHREVLLRIVSCEK